MASNVGVPPIVALSGASATSAAGVVLDGGEAHAYHTLVVTSSGGVSGGVVALELSHDNVNWFAPASNIVTTAGASTVYGVTVGPVAAQFARARISTVITGGTVTATLASA